MAQDKIAIIGVGCKFPGADNLDEFWRVLSGGENHVIEIPPSRWFHDSVYDEDYHALGRTYARHAGLLKDHLAFDNKFFNIKDIEADTMDPQQRYVLECTHMALEDAGLTREDVKGSNTSVYVGTLHGDYRCEFNATSTIPDSYLVTGVANEITASRVSYLYDLRGQALVVDAACASSLAAIHLGIQDLRAGMSDMAFCGAPHSILSPDNFIHLGKASMLSAKGQCFSFSDQVDGYTRGEGCGMVILKRLSDALRDKNKIWATIETGCNNDGGTVAPMSKPSEKQQIALMEQVYSRYNIDVNSIDYIEAHGTGTPVGDVIEVNALGKFFKRNGAERFRYMGSVKTNIGHLESAAGVAGLLKVLLMMKHSKIVPSLHCQTLNPNIDFQGFKFCIPKNLIDWPSENKMACLNSLGFGGTNYHAIVEAHKRSETDLTKQKEFKTEVKEPESCYITCFSAQNEESLKASMTDFINYPDVHLLKIADVSFTSTIHRDHFPCRQAFVSSTTCDLVTQITEQLRKGQEAQNEDEETNVVFVFCGMGTAWAGMFKDLIDKSQVFRETFRAVDKFLQQHVPWSLEDRLRTELNMDDHIFWPIAVFTCQIALANLWKSLGVAPNSIVGYSVGEVAAAHIAGFLSLPEAVCLIYHRTKIVADQVGRGQMLLFKDIDVNIVEEEVKKWPGKANVSSRISPKACAVSGDMDAILAIEKEVIDKGKAQGFPIDVRDLKLPLGYHSHLVDSCKNKLRQTLNGFGSNPHNTVAMVSTVTGSYVDGPLTTEYWVNNLREPILFFDAVKKTFREKCKNIYIEIGPKSLISAHINDIFGQGNAEVVVSMRHKGNWESFSKAVAKAYKQGCSIHWKNLPHSGQTITPVPRYKFNPRRVLLRSETSAMLYAGLNFLKKEHPYVYRVETTQQFKIFLSLATFPSVYHHKVSGNLVIPGALYAECGFALSKHIPSRRAPQYSVSAKFKQVCMFTEKEPVILDLEMNPRPKSKSKDGFESYNIKIMHKSKLFAIVKLHPHSCKSIETPINLPETFRRCPEKIEVSSIYKTMSRLGVHYEPLFSLLVVAARSECEIVAELAIPNEIVHELSGTTLHPSVMDAMVQSCVLICPEDETKRELLPVSIGRLTSYRMVEDKMYVYTRRIETLENMTVFAIQLTTIDGQIIAEMEDFRIKFLTSERESPDHEPIDNKITVCTWLQAATDFPIKETLEQRTLYISDEPAPPAITSIKYDLHQDSSQSVMAKLELLKSTQSFKHLDYIIFSTNISVDDCEDGASIQERITNLFLVLKSVFTFPLQIPVYVFTKWAIKDDIAHPKEQPINPAQASVWGLITSAIIEQTADITVFDLHLSHDLCTLELMTSVTDFVKRNADLRRHREWIATKEALYIKHIVSVMTHTSLPSYRTISADRSQNVLQVSRCVDSLVDSFNVSIGRMQDGKENGLVDISVSTTFMQNPKLFRMSLPYSDIDPQRTHLGSGHVVFALEATGVLQDEKLDTGSGQIVSCYPCPVGSRISVPESATVAMEMFTHYRPGDLTRFVSLMSLSELIPGSSVTILASGSTRKLAEILEAMLWSGLRLKTNCNIVTVDELHTARDLNPNIVSLVLLDKYLTIALARLWPNGEVLITVSDLMHSNQRSLMRFHLPNVIIIAPAISDFFEQRNILQVVPRVKKWLTVDGQCLGTGGASIKPQSVETSDLNEILEVTIANADRSMVRVDQSSLFKSNALYCVVGGLTGLGWIYVNFLASHGAGHIAILNRRRPTEEKLKELQDLAGSRNCQLETFQCDISDMESLSKFFNDTKIVFPNVPLKGIFCGAAATFDDLLVNVTREDLDTALSAKVKGSWNLHQKTKHLDLDYFHFMTSVTSIIGTFGQTSYGVANAFINGLTSYRRHMNLAAESVNWGPLAVGMLKGNQRAQQQLKERGLGVWSVEEIHSLLTPLLLLDQAQLISCKFDADIWTRNSTTSSATHEINIGEDLRRDLQKAENLTREQSIAVYERYITHLAVIILGVPKKMVKPDSRLQELGMDSLMAMTIRNEIFKDTQCRLPAIVLVSVDASVRVIAESLDQHLHEAQNV